MHIYSARLWMLALTVWNACLFVLIKLLILMRVSVRAELVEYNHYLLDYDRIPSRALWLVVCGLADDVYEHSEHPVCDGRYVSPLGASCSSFA